MAIYADISDPTSLLKSTFLTMQSVMGDGIMVSSHYDACLLHLIIPKDMAIVHCIRQTSQIHHWTAHPCDFVHRYDGKSQRRYTFDTSSF